MTRSLRLKFTLHRSFPTFQSTEVRLPTEAESPPFSINKAKSSSLPMFHVPFQFNCKFNGLQNWAEQRFVNCQYMDEPDFYCSLTFICPGKCHPGKPTAAHYGLGGQWLDVNLTAICGMDSPCTCMTQSEIHRHYSAGPPYMFMQPTFFTLPLVGLNLLHPLMINIPCSMPKCVPIPSPWQLHIYTCLIRLSMGCLQGA